MSYILDALRRAEAERQRGQVPGLGAAMAPLPASDTAPQVRKPAWWLIPVLTALGVAAAIGWWLMRASAPAPAGVAEPSAGTVTAVPGPASAAALPPTPMARADDSAPVAAPALPVVVSAPAAPPVVEAASALGARAAASSVAGDGPTVRLADLSPQQRIEWPPLALGGSVWSDSPANRFVIIDGQLLHEGQTVRRGLVLERIGPRAAWLRWRGLRVEVPL
jgi:general secretion pathway protein B